MTKERLLAYTDAVIAIIITIMVLEFRPPHTSDWYGLYDMRHMFVAYILSFAYLTIYWNNHHNTFHNIHKIWSGVLWSNSILLFFLSLIPFTTAWMAENHFEKNTVVAYGVLLLLCALSYMVIIHILKKIEWPHSAFTKAIDKDMKGKISVVLYTLWTLASFWFPIIGLTAFTIVALMWFIPDTRMEKIFKEG